MTQLLRLASLIFNQAHYIMPAAAEAILQVFQGRLGEDLILPPREPAANRFAGKHVFDDDESWRGYSLTKGGVALVPIIGELVNRGAYLGASSGLVSYEGLRQQLRNAAADPRAKALVLDIDSPGGMVSGMTETAALVRRIAGEKPVIAVANATMASAAYGIASGATRIVATDAGAVGSIGVVYVHADRSGEMARRGIKVTFIHAGAKKVDGHPFAALPDHVRADIQARIDALYAAFIVTVMQGRPQLSERQIRDTEADDYLGSEAVARGLADEVGTFDQAVADAEAGKVQVRPPAQQKRSSVPSQPPPQQVAATRRAKMPRPNEQPGPDSGWEHMTVAELDAAVSRLRATLGISEAEASPAVASLAAATAAAASQQQGQETPAATAPAAPAAQAPAAPAAQPAAHTPYQQGQLAERGRIKAILDHAEAAERQVQAHVLALETDMTAEQAGAVLAKLPKEQQAKGGAAEAFYSALAANGGKTGIRHLASDAAEKRESSLAAGMDRLLARQPKPRTMQVPARQ